MPAPSPSLSGYCKLVEGKQTLLAQTHDFPDPDTIASALALGWLLGELRGLEATIGYGGIIGRAENKAMIKQLGIKMKRTSSKDFEKYDLVALLDTQPEVGNHCVPNSFTPDIVFDHHFPRELEGPTPTFHDVGGAVRRDVDQGHRADHCRRSRAHRPKWPPPCSTG